MAWICPFCWCHFVLPLTQEPFITCLHHHFRQALSVCLLLLVKQLAASTWQAYPTICQASTKHIPIICQVSTNQLSIKLLGTCLVHNWCMLGICLVLAWQMVDYAWQVLPANHLTRSNKQTESAWRKWWCILSGHVKGDTWVCLTGIKCECIT